MTQLVIENLIGKRFQDAFGRSLKVISVHPGDIHGREVRGRIKLTKDVNAEAHDYATTFKTFDTYFIKKIVPGTKNRKIW